MSSGSRLFALVGVSFATAFGAAAAEAATISTWLISHVGEGGYQISRVVPERARALCLNKVSDGKVKNACYLAMDANRPNDLSGEKSGGRFYAFYEAEQIFLSSHQVMGAGMNSLAS